jgi:diguanylate cyclase (GGDEF)-like protein/PAS domain S-box-containing protein
MKELVTFQEKIRSIDALKKIWVVPVSLSIYILCFPFLFKQLDRAALTFYFFPTLIAGFLLGRRWGLAVGILFGPINYFIFRWMQLPLMAEVGEWYFYYIFVCLYLIFILGPYLVGYLQETRLRYQQALQNRHQVSAALRQSEKRYRQLLNHSSNIIVLFDEFGRVEYITPSAESLSGFTPKELIGKHFAELIHPDWRIKTNLFYARQIKNKTQKTYAEFPIITKDQRKLWVANVVELLFDQGQVSGGQGVLMDITSRVEAQQALKTSEERFRSITEHSSDITMILNEESVIEYISPSSINITKFEPQMVLNHRFEEFVHPDHQHQVIKLFEEILISPPGTVLKSGPILGLHRDGRWLYFDSTLINMLHIDSVSGIVVNVREITQQVEMEKELCQSEYSFRTLFNQANDAVLMIALEGMILESNQRATELFGLSPQEIIGKHIQDLLDEKEILTFRQTLDRLKHEHHLPISEWQFKHKDQHSIPVEINFGVIFDNQQAPTNIICIVRDISERKKNEDTLRHLATHDPLTKLPNRELFFSRFMTACEHADVGNYCVAVAFIDLDNFKDVNDEFGHAAGDEVLIQIANRLKNSVRQHDTLARMSGDEFTLLLEGVESVADVEKIIHKINQRMETPFDVSGTSLRIGVSIGISLYPQDSLIPEKVIQQADTAMYRSKNQNLPYHFYHPAY